jgi:hypothetical protein
MPIDYHWRITDHVCCYCQGRLLEDVSDESHVICANCGSEDGRGVKGLCWCGAGSQLGAAPVTIHCGANPNKTGSNMAEIIAIQGPPPDDGIRRKRQPAKR